MFDAVLFDNDGTLVSSIEAVVDSWLRWAREFDVDPRGLQNTHGRPTGDIVRDLVPPAVFDVALARIREIELTSPIPVRALPGAADALDATSGRNAVVTSADRGLFERRFATAGLPAPTVTVTFDDVTRGKPSPDPYVKAAQLLAADPSRCLVVEDAPAGVVSGHAGGMKVLGIASHDDVTFEPGSPAVPDASVADLSHVRFVRRPGGIVLTLVSGR